MNILLRQIPIPFRPAP